MSEADLVVADLVESDMVGFDVWTLLGAIVLRYL